MAISVGSSSLSTPSVGSFCFLSVGSLIQLDPFLSYLAYSQQVLDLLSLSSPSVGSFSSVGSLIQLDPFISYPACSRQVLDLLSLSSLVAAQAHNQVLDLLFFFH